MAMSKKNYGVVEANKKPFRIFCIIKTHQKQHCLAHERTHMNDSQIYVK